MTPESLRNKEKRVLLMHILKVHYLQVSFIGKVCNAFLLNLSFSQIHSLFIQQIFIKYLLYTRCCCGLEYITVNETWACLEGTGHLFDSVVRIEAYKP